jgi:hypothetical protein
MKTVILSFLAGSAVAFAPVAQQAARTTALNMAFEEELGVQAPIGFFDPLGLLNSGSEAQFERLRFVELKHGRISMLAIAGYLTTEAGVRLPGSISFDGPAFADIPAGFGALSQVPGSGLFQMFAFVGFLETFVMKDITGGEFVGDFRNGFIDFGWDTFSDDVKYEKRAIELNNGRAAMMGILGLCVHEKLGNLGTILPIN